jgi:hypothetical protein
VATRKFDPPMPRGTAREIVVLYAVTEDLQSGRHLGGVRIENPFA